MKSQQSGRGEVVVSRGHPYAAECNRGNVLHGKYGVGGEEAMPVLCGRIWLSFRLKSFWHLEHVVSVSAYVSKDFIPLSPVHLCLQVEALIDGWALSKLAERSSWILCLLIEWAPLKSKTQCAQWGALLCLLLASSAAPHWSYCWLRKCRLLSVCFFLQLCDTVAIYAESFCPWVMTSLTVRRLWMPGLRKVEEQLQRHKLKGKYACFVNHTSWSCYLMWQLYEQWNSCF